MCSTKGAKMNPINSLVIEGNLVRDAIVKETQNGNYVSNFSIAVNRSVKTHNGEVHKEVSFFDVETWGDLAKDMSKKGTRGTRIRMVGRIKQNRWTGSDGKNYSRINIIADHIEFISQKKNETSEDLIPEHIANEVEVKEEVIAF